MPGKPHRVFRAGSATVRVFRITRADGYVSFEVRYRIGPRLVRFTRTKEQEALDHARTTVAAIKRGQNLTHRLTDAQAADYQQALDLIRPTGVPLQTALAEWLAEWQLRAAASQSTVAETVKAYLAIQQPVVGKSHFRHIRVRLNRFAAQFNIPLASLAAADISAWLAAQGSPRTINNVRRTIAACLTWARADGRAPTSWDPLRAVPVGRKIPPVEVIQIYTPAEIRQVLAVASRRVTPFLALAAFAGLRHAELTRLDWSAVNSAHITIDQSISKTASRRIVPLLPNLAALLAPHRRTSGPITGAVDMSRQIARAFDQAGVVHHRNALRHSFISYRVAQTQNIAQVALEAGNSPKVIFQNYRELVPTAAAAEWFTIGLASENRQIENGPHMAAR